MIPRRPPTFENPMTDPPNEESISREMGLAGSEFPRGESIRRKSREVKSLYKISLCTFIPNWLRVLLCTYNFTCKSA
jgi:hypothetical protein